MEGIIPLSERHCRQLAQLQAAAQLAQAQAETSMARLRAYWQAIKDLHNIEDDRAYPDLERSVIIIPEQVSEYEERDS